jgi:hypothetical protein
MMTYFTLLMRAIGRHVPEAASALAQRTDETGSQTAGQWAEHATMSAQTQAIAHTQKRDGTSPTGERRLDDNYIGYGPRGSNLYRARIRNRQRMNASK